MGFPPFLNLSTRLFTAALPSQTTKTALTEEFMFQNVAYRPTVYRTGILAYLEVQSSRGLSVQAGGFPNPFQFGTKQTNLNLGKGLSVLLWQSDTQ